MTKQMLAYNDDEAFFVRGGIAIPLDAETRETNHGKYLPHDGSEVVVLPPRPWSWWRGPKPRRIVLYPEASAKPFPLAGKVATKPGDLGSADVLNLYGPYMPGVFRRAAQALIAEFEKMRTKDWIVIGLCSGALVLAAIAAVYAWKTYKLVQAAV
jgi:hypothetical protein